MLHMNNGDPEAAAKAFGAAVRLDPENAKAWYGKGCAHAEIEQYQEAIDAHRQSARFAGDRAALPLYNMGIAYQELGDIPAAIRCYRDAVEADPGMADAWINLGRIRDDAGQHLEAIEHYDTALAVEPGDAVAWSNRGNSLRALGRLQESLESYRRTLELDRENLAARVGIGACLVDGGEPAAGIAALRRVVDDTGEPVAAAELGTALARTGNHGEAVPVFDAVIEAGFTSAEISNNRAECLASLDRIDEALSGFDDAMALNPGFAPAWFGKARVLVNAGRIDEARPVAQRYRELADETNLSNPSVRALLSLCGIER
jgi:superkiller protein 3